jgi:anti-sigma factor RsiW
MNGDDDDDRKEIEALLPWHAAGTLSQSERQRVEAALAREPGLAAHLEVARDEMAETIALNEALGTPSSHGLESLFAKIDAEPARKAALPPNRLGRIGEFFASLSPQTLAWSAAAAAFVLLLQAGVIGDFMLKQKPSIAYQTASEASKSASAGTRVLIRFAPQADVAAITQFLQANQFTIIDGPSAGGLYTLRVATAKLSSADLQSVLARIQRDKTVGLVLPAE